MALTKERLQSLVTATGLKFFIDPNRDALFLAGQGMNGRYEFLILLELGGEFLQFRTLRYHTCASDHQHLNATLRVLGQINLQVRFSKFAWDPSDGEIVAYGDIWISDSDVTKAQMDRMLKSYLSIIVLQYARIDATIKTGKDPGELNPSQGPSGLPPEVQKVLDRIRAKRDGGGGDKDDDGEPPGIDEL